MSQLSNKPVLQKLSEKFQLILSSVAQMMRPDPDTPPTALGMGLAVETLPDGTKQERVVLCWSEVTEDKVSWTPLADMLPKARVEQMKLCDISKNDLISSTFYRHLTKNAEQAGGFRNITPDWLVENTGPDHAFVDLTEQILDDWRNN